MTFTVNRKLLLSELAGLQSVAERKGTIPILSTILFQFDGEYLYLTATDLDRTMLTRLPASGEPWGGCVPARQLYALARLLEGDGVTLTPQPNGRLQVKCGAGKHLLPTYPTTEFPAVDTPSDGLLTLDAALLTAMIQSVQFSMLPDNGVVKAADQRFTGLQMSLGEGKFRLEASRKVTFAVAECVAEGETFTTIIPPSAINALLALADSGNVTIGITESRATFHNGERTLIARLFVANQFPDFTKLIPEFTQSATVESSALKLAIQRSLLTTNTDRLNRPESLKLTFAQKELTVESQGGDSGKSDELIPVTSNLNGEAQVFGIFGNQILDWLAVAGNQVKVELNAPTLIRLSSEGEQTFKSEYLVCGCNLKW